MRLAVSCANTHVLAGSFVGLTVMSVGTSLPELATHVVASLQPSLHAVLRGDDPFGRFARLASVEAFRRNGVSTGSRFLGRADKLERMNLQGAPTSCRSGRRDEHFS